jgi:hypothetical protein
MKIDQVLFHCWTISCIIGSKQSSITTSTNGEQYYEIKEIIPYNVSFS